MESTVAALTYIMAPFLRSPLLRAYVRRRTQECCDAIWERDSAVFKYPQL
jgi:hypothetical protein